MSRSSKTGEENRSKFVVTVALLANLAIAVSKLVAALVSESSAMIAETAHTLGELGRLRGCKQNEDTELSSRMRNQLIVFRADRNRYAHLSAG